VKKPKISCVLPTYNNAAFLPRTLDSLVKQTLKDIEIIVVDDCSDDSTKQVLTFYKKKYKNIKTSYMDNRRGAAVCRNFGNMIAKADLIMVCDSGDVNHLDRAKNAYYFFKKYPDVDIYSTACIETNAIDEHIDLHYPRVFSDKEKPSLFHPTVTYRKEVTDKIKYREGNLATDQYEAFFIEAFRCGFKFWHTTDGFVKKLRQDVSVERAKQRVEQRKKNFKEFGIETDNDNRV
jgi:glycosyltransferase involved in cell wall biosynthesis